MKTISIAPPYLQFFISDVSLPGSPIQGETISIVSNGLCLSVPCQYAYEGDTLLTVGDVAEVPKDGILVYEGEVPTPSGVLVFGDAELTELLRYPVREKNTKLTIWTDGQQFPARVVVGVK